MKNKEHGHWFGIVNNEISKVDILRISLPYPEKMCSDTPWEPLPPTGLKEKNCALSTSYVSSSNNVMVSFLY